MGIDVKIGKVLVYFYSFTLFMYILEFQVLETVKNEFVSAEKDDENLHYELNSEKYMKDEIKKFSKKIKTSNKSVEVDSNDCNFDFRSVFICYITIIFCYYSFFY
jgi:hypothetical protein